VQAVQPARPRQRLLARLVEGTGGRWQAVLIENNISGLDDNPLVLVRPSPCIYILLPANELYLLSWFLLLLVLDGRLECPLGTFSLLTCEYAAGLVLYSLHVLTSTCHFLASLLVAHGDQS